MFPVFLAQCAYVLAVPAHFSRTRHEQRANCAKQARFAGTIGAGYAEQRTGRKFEIEPVEEIGVAAAGSELACFQHGLRMIPASGSAEAMEGG
jgi:hypothetical protein